MKTNVTMMSSDRDLFGTIIKQNTKDGGSLSISDLQKAYNFARFQNGWTDRRITDIIQYKPVQERIFYILDELKIINTGLPAFMEMIESEGIIKVLKGLKVWKTSGKGENKSTFANPYIWVLLALELNPKIHAKVIMWLTDSLIFNRVLAGAEFLPMNRAIKEMMGDVSPNYPLYCRMINEKVFGKHFSGIRNTASETELMMIVDIEKFIIQCIDLQIIRNENALLQVIERYNTNRKTA